MDAPTCLIFGSHDGTNNLRRLHPVYSLQRRMEGWGEMKVSRDFWLFCWQMSSEQLLWSVWSSIWEYLQYVISGSFICSLQRNKLGWNLTLITCTRPLFFLCFHCNYIVENCGMFLEKKKGHKSEFSTLKIAVEFSIYSQYLYILSPSLSVSLFSWMMPPHLGLVHPEPST